MGPFIGISSTGVLLALLAVLHRRHRLWFVLLLCLTAFMGVFGALSSWPLGFGRLTGSYVALQPYQVLLAVSIVVSLLVVAGYLVVLIGGLKPGRSWGMPATVALACLGALSGTAPGVVAAVAMAERSSAWIRVILNLAVLGALLAPAVRGLWAPEEREASSQGKG